MFLGFLVTPELCAGHHFCNRDISDHQGCMAQDSLEKVTHAFISSRLDYCNALLSGLPQSNMSKLQRIQKVAVKLLTGTEKFDHITPVLKSLLAPCGEDN